MAIHTHQTDTPTQDPSTADLAREAMRRGRQEWIKEGSALASGNKTLDHLRVDKAHAAQDLYAIMADPKTADHVDENYVTTAYLIGR